VKSLLFAHLLAVLSRDWAGLLLAALPALLAWALHALRAPWWLVSPLLLVAALMALASLRHLLQRQRIQRAHPAPGQRVDLGGYSVHMLAEGVPRPGRPSVVWFAGGHASGYAIHHLHRAFCGETRSILIDRPGTGWSDAGPFPRTTAREATEMLLALERAGEKGPFVLAGHSFGGLLAANMARRRPDLVHTLVLLDPTPLDTIVYGPRLRALKDMRVTSWLGGFAQLFGINLMARHEAKMNAQPVYAKALKATRDVLGPALTTTRLLDARSAAFFTSASVYNELRPEGVAAVAWDTVVYDRELGDLPVWLVGPKSDSDNNSDNNSDSDIAALPEAKSGSPANAQRMGNFYAASRERYMATSSNARRVVAPTGSGHNFVYEHADWTIGVMRQVICGQAD
jgi:pimeloyl-ACP methyl ester carboxylesterase